MNITWRKIASCLCSILGWLAWGYIGIWNVVTGPMERLVAAHLAGRLTLRLILAALVQGFFYFSLAGGVWCVGYMLRNYFKNNE